MTNFVFLKHTPTFETFTKVQSVTVIFSDIKHQKSVIKVIEKRYKTDRKLI